MCQIYPDLSEGWVSEAKDSYFQSAEVNVRPQNDVWLLREWHLKCRRICTHPQTLRHQTKRALICCSQFSCFDVQASLTLMFVLCGLSKHLSSFKVFQILPGKLSGSKKTILGCQTLILRKFCPKLMQDVHSFNLINHRKRKPTLKYVKGRQKESFAKKPEWNKGVHHTAQGGRERVAGLQT